MFPFALSRTRSFLISPSIFPDPMPRTSIIFLPPGRHGPFLRFTANRSNRDTFPAEGPLLCVSPELQPARSAVTSHISKPEVKADLAGCSSGDTHKRGP